MGGEPIIEIEEARTLPVDPPQADETTASKSESRQASRGTPNPAHVIAHAGPVQTSSEDVVPEAEPMQPARFKMSLSSHPSEAGAHGEAASPPSASNDVVADTDVTDRARKIGGASPAYPLEAARQGVELGSPLAFEVVVDTSGHVEQARPLSHAGYGFDEAAMSALRTFRFSPATRGGRAVRVRMRWTVDFHFN